MAKIVVTAYPGPHQQSEKRIIDADVCEFKGSHGGGTHVILEHGGFIVKESIEEICKLINEAEAQATNKKLDEICKLINETGAQATTKKLDEILKNQVTITKRLKDLQHDIDDIMEEVNH